VFLSISIFRNNDYEDDDDDVSIVMMSDYNRGYDDCGDDGDCYDSDDDDRYIRITIIIGRLSAILTKHSSCFIKH
jgi:hypothetical protein